MRGGASVSPFCVSAGDHVICGSYDCRLSWFDLDLSTKPYKMLRYVFNHPDQSTAAFWVLLVCFRMQCNDTVDGIDHVNHIDHNDTVDGIDGIDCFLPADIIKRP